MSEQLQEDDIGTTIKVTVKEDGSALDISTATVKQFILKKPSGTVVTKTASFDTDGTDGILKYETVADDLDEEGTWQLQVALTMVGTWKSSITTFTVQENLS